MQSYEFNVSYNVINAPFKAVKVVVLSWHEMQFDKKKEGLQIAWDNRLCFFSHKQVKSG